MTKMTLDEDWAQAKSILRIGTEVRGNVVHHAPFGLLVLIDGRISGVVERIGMIKAGYRAPDDYPAIGQTAAFEVLGFREQSQQVELEIKRA